MGKVVKFTGSKLLGSELRRLRGGRTLDDIVELGKAKLATHGFKGVAKATLSEIENGITLPNIESVFALSVLYQVPTSRFLHLLLEENLIADAPAVHDLEDVREAFAKAVNGQRPTEALALASRALRDAPPGWESVRWRLNRASALERLGMRWDAITEFNSCLESRLVPSQERYKVHFGLATMHASAGQLELAEMHMRRAQDLAPRDVDDVEKARLLHGVAALLLRRREWGFDTGPEGLDAIEECVSAALELEPSPTSSQGLGLRLQRAIVMAYRGDRRAARREFQRCLEAAKDHGFALRQIDAARALAHLDRPADVIRARALLTNAAELAVDSNSTENAFLCYFELSQLAENDEQRAHFLRKCRRLYPFVQSMHPWVAQFEATNAREVQ